jgi:hypothetical protein
MLPISMMSASLAKTRSLLTGPSFLILSKTTGLNMKRVHQLIVEWRTLKGISTSQEIL